MYQTPIYLNGMTILKFNCDFQINVKVLLGRREEILFMAHDTIKKSVTGPALLSLK